MLLSVVLSAATMAIVVHGALLRNELKSNKNRSVQLAESLRKKLMSENYDYMPPDSDELSDKLESSEIQESLDKQEQGHEINLRARYDGTSSANERVVKIIDNPNDEQDSLNDGYQRNLHETSRPVPGDIEDHPNVKMQHHDRNEPSSNYLSKDKISSRVDKNIKRLGDEVRLNKYDVPNQHMEGEKSEKLRGGKNYGSLREKVSDVEFKHDELKYVRDSMREYIGCEKSSKSNDKHDNIRHIDQEFDKSAKLKRDEPQERYDKHNGLKHIHQEPHTSAKVRNDKRNDQQIDNAELRRDKIDEYRYEKYNDIRHDKRNEMPYDDEKRNEKKDFQPYSRQDQPNDLKNVKRPDFEKRDGMKSEGFVDSRNNNLENMKTDKLRHDKRDYFIPNKHENERQANIINDKLRHDEREELLVNHEPELHHDLRNNDRVDIRQGKEEQHRPYKMRFEKRDNVLLDNPRQENTDMFKFDRMKHEKQNDVRLDQSKLIRDELKYDERNNIHLHQRYQDQSDKLRYQKRNEGTQSNFRDNKQVKLKEYDSDVFPQINHQLDKSNFRQEKRENSQYYQRPNKNYKFREHNRDNFRQDDMTYEKTNKERHNKRDKSQFNYDENSQHRTKNEQGLQNDQRPNKNDNFKEYNRDNFRQDDMTYYGKTNKERHNKRDDSQLNNNENSKHYTKNEHGSQNDQRPNKNDKFREHNRENFRQDGMTYEKANKERHNKRDDSQLNNDENSKHHIKNEHDLHAKYPKEKNKLKHYGNGDDSRQDDFGEKKKETIKKKREHDQTKDDKLRKDFGRDHHGDNSQSLKQNQPKEVPLKYDKLEQELEKQVLRITPVTKNYNYEYKNGKQPEKYKKNNNRNDNYGNYNYRSDSYGNDKNTNERYKNENHKRDKYKLVNNEYKYKKYEYKENDQKKNIKSRAFYRGRDDIGIHTVNYIAKQDREKNASIPGDTNSEFVPRAHESHEDHVVQMTENVSNDNDKYVPESNTTSGASSPRGGEKLQGEALDVAGVPAVPVVDARRRNAKKYKMLKMPVSSRRASEGTATRVVQEEGSGGVALVPLDGGVLPSFQLPAARRQYMPSDHDSEYQVDIYGEDVEIPGLNSYEEPNLNRINASEIRPPGLTASVQGTLDQLYSPHVEGPITQ